MAEAKKGSAVAIRDYFGLTVKEIKEFKDADPDGYKELAELCVEHYETEKL